MQISIFYLIFYKLTDTSYTSGQFYKLLALKPNTFKWWVIYLLVIFIYSSFFLTKFPYQNAISQMN